MPAAAVIPAPIAYIKVVAVKKLVVDLLRVQLGTSILRVRSYLTETFVRASLLRWSKSVTLLRKN